MAIEHQPGRYGHARVAIVTIIDAELRAARAVFCAVDEVPGSPYPVYYTDEVRTDRNYPFVVMKASGRGTAPAMEAVQEVVEHFRPSYIFLVGTAGGLNRRDNVDLGDVVIADYVGYAEFMKLTPGRVSMRHEPYDHPSLFLRAGLAYPLSEGEDWHSHIPATAKRPEAGTPKAVVGNIVAGEKVLSDRESAYQNSVLERFDAAIAVDMESYGFARSVFSRRRSVHYNPQCLIVRGISDIVEAARPAVAAGAPAEVQVEPDNNNEVRKLWSSYASHTAAAFARAVVERLPDYEV